MKEDHRSQRRNFAFAKTKPEKIQPFSGLQLLPSVIPVPCSINWANKPTRSRLSKRFVIKPSRCVYNCDDLLSFTFSPRSSYIWFQSIHCLIVILFRVYDEPTQWPAPIVGLIGRALHWYCTGKGSNPEWAWFFPCFLFATAKVASITALTLFHLGQNIVKSPKERHKRKTKLR